VGWQGGPGRAFLGGELAREKKAPTTKNKTRCEKPKQKLTPDLDSRRERRLGLDRLERLPPRLVVGVERVGVVRLRAHEPGDAVDEAQVAHEL